VRFIFLGTAERCGVPQAERATRDRGCTVDREERHVDVDETDADSTREACVAEEERDNPNSDEVTLEDDEEVERDDDSDDDDESEEGYGAEKEEDE